MEFSSTVVTLTAVKQWSTFDLLKVVYYYNIEEELDFEAARK